MDGPSQDGATILPTLTHPQSTARLLRETTTLSPVSHTPIPARVIEEDGRVYLVSTDESGATHRDLLETDAALYHRLAQPPKPIQPISFIIQITAKCNLHCDLCYEPDPTKQDLTPQEVAEIIAPLPRRIAVGLAGREPTMHRQLPEIIRTVSQRHVCGLITNGLRLVDRAYLSTLKRAGLHWVFFSFNGFDDDIYVRLNGEPLLQKKLAALENLRRERLSTILSVTLDRGVNDSPAEIRRIFDFALDRPDHIRELRFRVAVPLGRHPAELAPLQMSELTERICAGANVQMEEILTQYDFWAAFGQTFRIGYFYPKTCTFRFDVRRDRRSGAIRAVGRDIPMARLKRSRLQPAWLAYYFLREFGMKYFLERLPVSQRFGFWRWRPTPILKVNLRRWPSAATLDLDENMKCTTRYYKDGKALPFCYYNIVADPLKKPAVTPL